MDEIDVNSSFLSFSLQFLFCIYILHHWLPKLTSEQVFSVWLVFKATRLYQRIKSSRKQTFHFNCTYDIPSLYLIIVTMMAESITKVLFHHWPLILLFVSISYLLKNRFNRGLNKYPGPFLASLTNWWRFWDVYKRRPEVTHIKLHAKHGDVVRLGPNVLSFANPNALKTIYGLNKGFTKVRASFS
jgi:hypothetical protein